MNIYDLLVPKLVARREIDTYLKLVDLDIEDSKKSKEIPIFWLRNPSNWTFPKVVKKIEFSR